MKNKYIGDYYILLSLIRDLTNVRTFLNLFEWKFLEAICKHSGLTSNSQVTNRSPRCIVIGIVFDQWSLGVEAQRLWNGHASRSSIVKQTKLLKEKTKLSDKFKNCFGFRLNFFALAIFGVARKRTFTVLVWYAPNLLTTKSFGMTRGMRKRLKVFQMRQILLQQVDINNFLDILRNLQNSSKTLPFRPQLVNREDINPNLVWNLRIHFVLCFHFVFV